MTTTTDPVEAVASIRIPAQHNVSRPDSEAPPVAAAGLTGSATGPDSSGAVAGATETAPRPHGGSPGPSRVRDRGAPRLPESGRGPADRSGPRLPGRLTAFLRLAALVDLVAGVLLLLVRRRLSCDLRVCEMATLGGHPLLAGMLALAAAAVLAVAFALTEGLTRVGRREAGALTAVAVVGLAAALGLVLVSALVASLVALAAGVVIAVMIGMVPGHLTR